MDIDGKDHSVSVTYSLEGESKRFCICKEEKIKNIPESWQVEDILDTLHYHNETEGVETLNIVSDQGSSVLLGNTFKS